MSEQLDLFTDLPRGQQLQLLRRVMLGSYRVGKTSVSGAAQKAVLRCIDDHDGGKGCFATQQTLANETEFGVPSVTRAIRALLKRDLITQQRPNNWTSNTHRINWTELHRLASTTDHHDVSTDHGDASEASSRCVGGITMMPQRHHHDVRNDHLNENPTATSKRPDDWEAVAVVMFDWGLSTAGTALDSARERGWSLEYVQELFGLCGRDRTPERWEPGQLANWLTGRKFPPIDEAEASRRVETRLQAERTEATLIRHEAQCNGNGLDDVVVNGVICRKLRAENLEQHATDEERAALVALDEFDRQRNTAVEE